MKKALLLISILLGCTFSSIASDECCATSQASIEQKIRDIDLDIALEQYKQVRTERAKAELQLIMLETSDLSEADREQRTKQLRNRIDLFAMHADQLRTKLLAMSKEMAAAK